VIADYATIGGGASNTASGGTSTIGGGLTNYASGGFSTIGGGASNTASVDYSCIPGGRGLVTVGSPGVCVVGTYNNLTPSTGTALFTVGNGAGAGSRNNAFTVYDDGRCFSNGFYNTGADYAEYFEAEPDAVASLAVGYSVVMNDGTGRIRPAAPGEEPDGVVRPKGVGASTIVGNVAEEDWHDKWLRGPDGNYVFQSVPLEVPTGQPAPYVMAPVLNPAFDPTTPYIPRSERPEWFVVGLMGRVLLLPGQPTGTRWRRGRHYSDLYDEWLIR